MYTISEIAKIVNGKINGNHEFTIKGVCDIINGIEDHLSYINSNKYNLFLKDSKATAFLVNQDFNLDRGNKTLIYVNNPALSFIDVVRLFHPIEKPIESIHSSSIISSEAKLGKNVTIGPNTVIEDNVIIGNNIVIGANTFIGKGTNINDGCYIHPNVSIYNNVKIGAKCIINSGSVIGANGFGLVKDNKGYQEIPHIGSVIIDDDVLIGANCCIDRGTLNNTIIGKGTKLDNLIQIAHNVKIGQNCRISGQTAIAGSTIIEDNVTLAGQVGIIDHLTIGEGSTVASKSAVFQSIKPNSIVSGTPSKNHNDRLRQEVLINKLPEIVARIKKLENIKNKQIENK